jgi:hypothetical protein
MEVRVIKEAGYFEALIGIGLSYGLTSEYSFNEKICSVKYKKLEVIALNLSPIERGHNKFLESIAVWLDINAPRFWWQEFDTYRVGMTKQSESTIHTLTHNRLEQINFEYRIPDETLQRLNGYIDAKNFVSIKNELPEGFLQRRIICTNYKVLRHIIQQRRKHKLKQWKVFIKEITTQCEHPFFDDLLNLI